MIEIITRVRFATSRFISARRDGVLYDLGGEQVELFTLKVLGEALDRSRDTLLVWEERGHLPRPLFRVDRPRRTPSDGPWRMYSAAQVMSANKLALHHFAGRRRIDDRVLFHQFVVELHAVWYSPGAVASPRTARESLTSSRGGFALA